MPKNEIHIQTEIIDNIYQEYLGDLSDLRHQQDEIIKQFAEALKQEKLTELQKKLNIHYDKS